MNKSVRKPGKEIPRGERKRSAPEAEKTREDLERRVEERTRDLTAALEKAKREAKERRRAEKALSRTSKILEGFFASTDFPMAILDRDLNFVRVNASYAKANALQVSDFPGKNHFAMFPNAENEAIFRKVVGTREAYQAIAKPFVFLDHPEWGTTYWDWNLWPVLDGAGSVEFLVFSLEDVTAKTRAADQLREDERALQALTRYMRSLIEASLDPLVTISPEGKVTDVNRATELATGYSRDELIGSDFSDYFTDPAKARLGYQTAFSRGEVRDYPLAIRHAAGGVIEVVYNASVYRNAAGEVQGVFAAARDITERKKAEAERLRLAKALEQTAEGIVILDADQEVSYVNAAFEKITGVRAQDVLRSTYRDLLRSAGLDDLVEMEVKASLDRGERWTGHMIRQKPGVGPYEVDAAISPVFDETGTLRNFVAIERDVTDEVRHQELARQGQKMEALGTLAGGIAHDFNNILMPILINTEMSVLDESEGTPNAKRLKLVLEAANRGKELVKQIISFSRRKPQEKAPIRIAPVLKEGLTLLRASLPKNVEIVDGVGAESAVVLADATQIQQVLINLCSNAGYAMREKGGTLTVKLSEAEIRPGRAARLRGLQPGPYLELTVKDTGFGMTPEVRRKAFDPFFTTKAPGEGSGIGLSVVHRIVEDIGGAIDVESEAGKGSTFTVFFPRIPGGDIKEVKPQARPPKGSGRILFVDDEEIHLQSVPPILGRLGYDVVGRTDVLAALALFRESPGAFDCVITDQMMPAMTGEKLALELRKVRPDIPIILCTGFSETVTEDRAAELGIGAFLMKPFSVKEIADAIRAVMPPKGGKGPKPETV